MRRRDFISLLGSAMAFRPGTVATQQGHISPQHQADTNLRWFLLNSGHKDFAATRANLIAAWNAHKGTAAEEFSGANGNEKIVKTYMTAAEVAASSPPLAIGKAAVLDEANYSTCINPNDGPREIHISAWGDIHPKWGAFLEQPQGLPTTAVDRLIQHWRDGKGSVLYIAQTARGAGNGSSYLNACAVKQVLSHPSSNPEIDPAGYNILVLCGNLSRFKNEGAGAQFGAEIYFTIRSGTPATRTQVVAHPVAGGNLMGGCKIGSGEGETYHEDSVWAKEGNNTWSCRHTNHVTANHFVLSDAGGTLRALTKTASVAACNALTDSYYITSTKTYVHLLDGSNPHQTTYFGGHNFNGVRVKTLNTAYFDFFGVGIYQQAWRGPYHLHNTHYGLYGCRCGYINLPFNQVLTPNRNLATGKFDSDPHQPIGCVFQGNWFGYCSDVLYHTSETEFVPIDTTVVDNYFTKIGADAYGTNLGNTDSHSFGHQGTKSCILRNNRFHQCGWVTIILYQNGVLYDAAPTGKENEPLYAAGWPPAYSTVNVSGEEGRDFIYHQPVQDLEICWNWITEPITNSDNSSLNPEGYCISLVGDNRHLGYAGQVKNVKIYHNRIEGKFNIGSIRTKFKPMNPSTYLDVEIYSNVVRGTTIGFDGAASSALDSDNNTHEPSFHFHHNDVHATSLFVNIQSVVNPSFHDHILDYQVYRTNDRAGWKKGATTYTASQFKAWQHAAPLGDTYDPNSTTTTLP